MTKPVRKVGTGGVSTEDVGPSLIITGMGKSLSAFIGGSNAYRRRGRRVVLDEFHCSAAQTLISVRKGVRMINHPTMGNSSALEADGKTQIDRASQPASPAQAFQVMLIAPQQPSTSLQSVLPAWTVVNTRLVCHFGACPSIHTCRPSTGASRPQAAYSRATTRPIGEGENHRPLPSGHFQSCFLDWRLSRCHSASASRDPVPPH